MQRLRLAIFAAVAFGVLLCSLSNTAYSQRKQKEPIVKTSPSGGVEKDPEELFLKKLTNKSPHRILQYALNQYQFGFFAKAESLFTDYRQISSEEPPAERDLGQLMHAKTLIRLKRYQPAIEELTKLKFSATYPALRQETIFDLGVAETHTGKFYSAAERFMEVGGQTWSTKDSLYLRKKAITNLRLLAMTNLSLNQIEKLIKNTPYINLKAVLAGELMRKSLSGDFYDAQPLETKETGSEKQVSSPAEILESSNSGDQFSVQQRKDEEKQKVKDEWESEEYEDESARDEDESSFEMVVPGEVVTLEPRGEAFIERLDTLLRNRIIPIIDTLLMSSELDPAIRSWLIDYRFQASDVASRRYQHFPIGVLLPIDLDVFDGSESQRVGSQILTGMALRAFEHNRSSPMRYISLLVRNTEGVDSLALIRVMDELIDRDSVKIILGPIFSDKAVIAAQHAAAREFPLITPTATDERITKAHPTCFQMNPPHRTRGKIIADYFLEDSTKKTFGIFAEQMTYGVEMAEGFKDEVLAHGGKMKMYSLLPFGFRSLKEAVDTLHLEKPEDFMGYPETKFDAIYLPLTTMESIGIALSQLHYYNFTGQIVGSGDWHDANVLNRFSDMLNGTIYAIDTYVSSADPRVYYTLEKYYNFWQSHPSTLFWHGADAIDYLTETIVNKEMASPCKISEALRQAPPYKAVRTEIFFDGGNINQSMNIMQFSDGNISKLK
ncbi:ABC-type branched-chain amino acid transport systems periplasmic component-like protein [Chloroherpeton thalassium ATCC 35110]|uniref:ABC-type branched-chain amino acid transport systems periplasmic component-like protein n=1 Tax=Chloroherpeton thalassium (strain ATCC 35110 / GB-78) TaxID=517418 RepID=B3QUR2_CHLT3|nr:ABC transporter substrate-binding protein [Chloroherpeton thalassium]ACF12968.1 ABC-type branched-chain amino acid transport systems periplasmic component-like protein [Chloroherpeton thalassium ATCC 35110]